jgi:hypothetical protein
VRILICAGSTLEGSWKPEEEFFVPWAVAFRIRDRNGGRKGMRKRGRETLRKRERKREREREGNHLKRSLLCSLILYLVTPTLRKIQLWSPKDESHTLSGDLWVLSLF